MLRRSYCPRRPVCLLAGPLVYAALPGQVQGIVHDPTHRPIQERTHRPARHPLGPLFHRHHGCQRLLLYPCRPARHLQYRRFQPRIRPPVRQTLLLPPPARHPALSARCRRSPSDCRRPCRGEHGQSGLRHAHHRGHPHRNQRNTRRRPHQLHGHDHRLHARRVHDPRHAPHARRPRAQLDDRRRSPPQHQHRRQRRPPNRSPRHRHR